MLESINWEAIWRVVNKYRDELPFQGKNVLILTHAKSVTPTLCRACVELGAAVDFSPVDYSIDNRVIETLQRERGITVLDESRILEACTRADIVFEDGARIGRRLVANQSTIIRPNCFALEQTTSGILYYKSISEENLPYPIINIGESRIKLEVENSFATPQSIMAAFISSINASLSGKYVLIVGYGFVGNGIARLCRALGSVVTIFDKSPVRRMVANGNGFNVVDEMSYHSVLESQDIIISCTANTTGSTIGLEEICLMKDCAVIFNAGSGTGEISEELVTPGTYEKHRATITSRLEGGHSYCEVKKHGNSKHIKIMASGHPINLRMGSGSPPEVIDIVFSLMLLSAIKIQAEILRKGIIDVGREVEDELGKIIALGGPSAQGVSLVTPEMLNAESRPFGTVTPIGGRDFSRTYSLARAVFKPGSSTEGHFHLRTEETYIIEQGTAKISVWNYRTPDQVRTIDIKMGDFLTLPPGTAHKVEVSSSIDLVALVLACPPFSHWDQFFPG